MPLVDSDSVHDQEKYVKDAQDCEAYARTVDPAGQGANAALIGGLLGLGLGALAGSRDAAHWAGGLTALSAGADSYAQGKNKQRRIYSQCLIGRGYRVMG